MNNTSINIKEFNPKYREFYYWPILKTDNYDSVVIPLVKEYEASLTDSFLDNWEDCNKTIEHLFSERAIWGFWTDEPQGNEQYRFNSYSLALILRGYYKYIDQQRRTNFNDSILDHACEELETTDFPSISTKPPFCIKQDPLLKGFHKLLLCSYLSNDGDSDLILNFEVRYGDSRVFNKIRRKALEVLCGSLCPWIESVYEYNHLLYLKNYEVDSIFENGPEDVRKLYVPSKLLASVRDNSDGPITKDTLLDFAKRSTYLYLGGDDDEEIGKIDYQTLMKFRDIFNDYDSGETGEQAAQPIGTSAEKEQEGIIEEEHTTKEVDHSSQAKEVKAHRRPTPYDYKRQLKENGIKVLEELTKENGRYWFVEIDKKTGEWNWIGETRGKVSRSKLAGFVALFNKYVLRKKQGRFIWDIFEDIFGLEFCGGRGGLNRAYQKVKSNYTFLNDNIQFFYDLSVTPGFKHLGIRIDKDTANDLDEPASLSGEDITTQTTNLH